MSKSTITRMFVGSLIAIVGGLVLMVVAFAMGLSAAQIVVHGDDVVQIGAGPLAPVAIGLMTLAALAMVGGAIGQFVAWILALLNTAQLVDKTWFVVLLILGLLSFGFIPMLIYVLVGPDATTTPARDLAHAPA
jgi:hypothetical protein